MSTPDLQLCSAQDVIDCFGGNNAEALSTMNKWARGATSTFDQTTLNKPILAGSAEYARSCGNKFSFPVNGDVNTYPMDVRCDVALLSARWFALFTGQLQQIPVGLKEAIDRVTATMEKLENGKLGTGLLKPPPSRISGDLVDLTQGGTIHRMSLDGWGRL
jgi:hypothetical protein